MARALLLALTWAAAASAARYVDYSGVKMPAYGAGDYEAPREPAAAPPSDDYRGHSPDAPASPDYKYEEEPRIKTEKPAKDSDEPEVWRKPGRKQRGLIRPPLDSGADTVRKYERDDEDVPKYRTSHRYPKHRSRLKDVVGDDEPPRWAAKDVSGDDEPPRRAAKYSRDRKDDVSDIDSKDYFHVDKDDFPDDKSKEFEEDVKFVNEATTRRASRRKPRDRFVKRKSSDLDIANDEDELDQRIKSDETEGPRRTRPPEPRPFAPHAPRGHVPERFRAPPDDDEDEPVKLQSLGKPKHKPFEDYDDYYDDMKRVNSIKNKLPSLLRRTTEPAAAPTPTSYLDMLWTSNRRMLPPTGTEELGGVTARVPSPRPRTFTVAASLTSTTSSATHRTRTTTLAVTTTTVSTTTANATALSLAEKSRLSILKKDQRKKGQHVDAPTQKPPVLLQVSQYMPTVVMVEPPTSVHPWLRVRELSEDSPERLEKVKKMMRHKLVSEAKSIHDLTNNWDEMVCDYIDVALVDGAASAGAPAALQDTRAPAPLACGLLHVWGLLHVYFFI